MINVGLNEYITVTSEPTFQAGGFYPQIPFILQANDAISRSDKALAVVLGQYDSASGIERLYNNVQYDVYYSTLSATTGPTILSVDGFYNTQSAKASFKVEASDPYTVTRVLIAYTTGAGTWSSLDLSYNSVTRKWAGLLPGIRGATYYIQAVNSAGNATVISKKGGYFSLEDVSLTVQEHNVYLPLVVR